MERNEKESLNVNNFGHYMLDFISDRVKISGQSNSDKWSLLFQKIEEWKKQYFISSELVEIFGVNGWYVDLEFSRFRHMDLTVFQKQDYVTILLLIDLLNSCDKDAMEYKCIEDTEFESYFHTGYDYQAKECAVLSNVEFCDELQRLYDRSFERFQY